MPIVYRIEDESGLGPYWNGPGYCATHGSSETDDTRHPAPCDDGLDPYFGGVLFGFTSMEKLRAWFDTSVRSRLYRRGYKCAVYEVADIDIGESGKQCTFRRDEGHRISWGRKKFECVKAR